MNKVVRKWLVLPAIALTLSTEIPASAQYYYVRPNNDRPVLRSAIKGAGIGALGGLAVGLLGGRRARRHTLRNVGIGAGIGAGVGALYGMSRRGYYY